MTISFIFHEACTKKPYSFLVNNTMLPSDSPLQLGRTYLKNEYYWVNQSNW